MEDVDLILTYMEIKYFNESIFSPGDEVLSFGRRDKVYGSIVKAAK